VDEAHLPALPLLRALADVVQEAVEGLAGVGGI